MPVAAPWRTRGRGPRRDGGRRGAARGGHGVRARGRYLLPVHQEENGPSKLRNEDKAHKDEELEGSGMKESGTRHPGCPSPVSCAPGTGGHRGRAHSSGGQTPHLPAPRLQGGGL